MSTVRSRTASARTRGLAFWVAAVVVVVLLGALVVAIGSRFDYQARDALDPDSAGPNGTRALAAVLADHGVVMQIVRTRADAAAAVGTGDATLVLPDSAFLSDDAFETLADAAAALMVPDAGARAARLLFDADVAGFGTSEPLAPACDVRAAGLAGDIVVGTQYTLGSAQDACYPDAFTGGYGLLTATRDGRSIAALDASELFTNAQLATGGNAALAVNLLATQPRVVWYVPSISDSDIVDADRSLADLAPRWVTPVLVILALAGLAAAFWRGRRFGPLVAETLPVTVRGAETTEGRARLYARSHDAAHALDQLRIAALARIARLLSLGSTADPAAIADAAAARLGADPRAVRGILVDDLPRTDRDLVALADRVRDVEDAIRAVVRPPATPSAPPPPAAPERSSS